METEVEIGEFFQSEKELWIKTPAPVKQATTMIDQRNWETFDFEEPTRDKPWIVDVAKKISYNIHSVALKSQHCVKQKVVLAVFCSSF